jgi:hypothetical protein
MAPAFPLPLWGVRLVVRGLREQHRHVEGGGYDENRPNICASARSDIN